MMKVGPGRLWTAEGWIWPWWQREARVYISRAQLLYDLGLEEAINPVRRDDVVLRMIQSTRAAMEMQQW